MYIPQIHPYLDLPIWLSPSFLRVNMCYSGLNKNCLYGLGHLNTWFLVGAAVGAPEAVGGEARGEKPCHRSGY